MYRNEQIIDSIYVRQLESVIFSINQYSDDVVSSWANKLEQDIQNRKKKTEEIASSFIQWNKSVEMLFFIDSLEINEVYFKNSVNTTDTNSASIQQTINGDSNQIARLRQYMNNGYRKIQPIDIDLPNSSLFIFAFKDADNNTKVCGIIVKTLGFIKENLGPKIQSVARDEFYFSVFDAETGDEVYSNEVYETANKNIQHKKKLWIMPDHQLGIQLKGETIEDLVQRRTRFNILIILLIDFVLVIAAIFIYRSLRQEMKLAQLKSEFISNVSHEIRTPLAIINMYSETLSMNRIKDENKKKEYYNIINTEASRLSGMVNKILNFSKTESGNRTYKFIETDVNVIVAQILGNYEHHFKRNGFKYNFSPKKKLPKVMTDEEAVTDAIINLFDNAIKYSKDKKQIDISTGSDNTGVFVEIKDFGLGIDEKYQKMVFDKFYRVTDGNLAHKAKGSGIGLSIVSHIMDAHKGSVKLISKVDEGSTFILKFPLIKT
jgi:two-component system phosphate regulon sensor histidine kinase PhoR